MFDRRVVSLTLGLFAAANLPATTCGAGGHPERLYGGTADVRFLSVVEAMLEAETQAEAKELQRGDSDHREAVTIFFKVDEAGRVRDIEIVQKSGDPTLDALALRILKAAAPFPTPSPAFRSHGLYWQTDLATGAQSGTHLQMK